MAEVSLAAISQGKLPETVEECHQVIKDLFYIIEQLQLQINELHEENKLLKERLNLNSKNSSKPPSSDHKKSKNKRKSSGKPSGGQPGHPGHYRALLEEKEVDHIVPRDLDDKCAHCGGIILANEDYLRHQVHELPPIKLEVTEYQLAQGQCSCCGRKQTAPLPEGVGWGITGPNLTSFMSMMVTSYQLSRRQLTDFLEQYFNFKISLGTVFNKQKIVNNALAAPVEGVLSELKKSHCHLDETGHRRDGVKQWLWTVASPEGAYYGIYPSRGKKVVKNLMDDFKQVAITDRYSVYNYFDSSRHQFCWAHLKRDFVRISERKEVIAKRLGSELLKQESSLFDIWHRFKDSRINREELYHLAKPIRRAVGECLEQGLYTAPELRLVRLCKMLLENFDALWVFLEVEGVEPTNNHAERCLRPNVIWRKKYFCTRSDYGSEYVSRTATMNMTCKLQAKNPFYYLADVVRKHFSGMTAPPLIPAT